MKYFLHDSNAFQDEKITELFMKFGYEGIGLFFTLLEKLALQEQPIKTEVLKKQLFIGKKLEKCWKFLESLQLISSNNGETFNKQLINFAGKYKIKKEKNAKRISEWRKNQIDTENVTCYETVTKRVRNTDKVKRSKEKEIKELNTEIETIYSYEILELNEWSKTYFDEKFINSKSLDIFDQLTRIDLYKINEIKDCIMWARGDQFWSSNFLSPLKLRNKNKEGIKYIDVFKAKLLQKNMINGNSKGITDNEFEEVKRFAKTALLNQR